MKKKGVAIAFNTIIIAAIALIVLAVVMYMLMTRATIFQRGVGECEARGGECKSGACLGTKPILAFKGCYVGTEHKESYNCCLGVDTNET
jgi:hypothetical protein